MDTTRSRPGQELYWVTPKANLHIQTARLTAVDVACSQAEAEPNIPGSMIVSSDFEAELVSYAQLCSLTGVSRMTG